MAKATADKHNLGYLLARNRWFWCGDSVEAAVKWRESMMLHVGTVFIDTDHSYELTKRELAAWAPLIGSSGVMCGHDFTLDGAGVSKAVNEFYAENKDQYDLMTWTNCFGFFVLTKK